MTVRTDAIRVFQKNVHEMNSANQRDIRLTAQEARNLSNELSQLTAYLVDLQTTNNTQQPVDFSIVSQKF
jgi:hypothetical protein